IRDFHVTGVQTCALPIWHPCRSKIGADRTPDPTPYPCREIEMKGSSKPPPPPSARRAEPGKPTSVRQLTADAQATPPAAAVEPEVVGFEVAGGASWTARAMGASIGPRGTAAAPLLLLRFTRDKEEGVESTKSEGSGDKQAWVPGRTLSD